MLSAAAFAESGEFDVAREMMDGNRKVLLVMTGRETDNNSFTYALNIAQRTGAELEVLTTATNQPIAEIIAMGEKDATKIGMSLKVAKVKGCVKDALFAHMDKRRDIICVVIESTEFLEIDCSRDSGSFSRAWEKLGCPLALVSERS
jgi:hypothetical protein